LEENPFHVILETSGGIWQYGQPGYRLSLSFDQQYNGYFDKDDAFETLVSSLNILSEEDFEFAW
jgi:hypothetical protein